MTVKNVFIFDINDLHIPQEPIRTLNFHWQLLWRVESISLVLMSGSSWININVAGDGLDSDTGRKWASCNVADCPGVGAINPPPVLIHNQNKSPLPQENIFYLSQTTSEFRDPSPSLYPRSKNLCSSWYRVFVTSYRGSPLSLHSTQLTSNLSLTLRCLRPALARRGLHFIQNWYCLHYKLSLPIVTSVKFCSNFLMHF